MKLETRIVKGQKYNEHTMDKVVKIIDGVLYNAIIGQKIKIIYFNNVFNMRVVGISDSVYNNSIYRFIECELIDAINLR